MDKLDNSVPSDAKHWPKGQICLSFPQTHVGFFFLAASA